MNVSLVVYGLHIRHLCIEIFLFSCFFLFMISLVHSFFFPCSSAWGVLFLQISKPMWLQDGPDILVCDEAHIIKNTRADTTQALKQVKCQRRIALTGSPLQNNLMEYYCVSC